MDASISTTVLTPQGQPLPTHAHVPRWLTLGMLALLQLSFALLLSWRTVDPDLWGHIQYGQDWISSGTLPRTATHTFTASEYPWINHENLFELTVALGQRLVGGRGLMAAKCLLGLLLLAFITHRLQRQGLSRLAATVCLLPVAAALAEYWQIRPQLFSFVLFTALLTLFDSTAGFPQNLRRFWWAIPLLIIWTNSHGGVIAGICVLIAGVVLTLACSVLQHRRIDWKPAAEGAALCLAAAGSLLVNPYGPDLPRWYAVSLSAPRPEVSEWAGLLDGGPAVVSYMTLVLLTITGLLLTTRQRNPVQILLLLIIAVQPIGHIRHLPFFAIAFAFWMPAHLVSAWQRINPRRHTAPSSPLQGVAARVLKMELGLLLAGLLAAVVVAQARFGVPRDEYPVNALEFMHRNDLHGRLVVSFNWAQYALAALTPNSTVAFDGRYDTCYPMQIVDWHFDLLFGPAYTRRYRVPESGPISQQQALNVGQPDLVLVNRRQDQPAVSFLRNHQDWQLVYQDGLACLFQRRSQHQSSTTRLRPELSDEIPAGIAEWPAFPDRHGRNAFLGLNNDAQSLQPPQRLIVNVP